MAIFNFVTSTLYKPLTIFSFSLAAAISAVVLDALLYFGTVIGESLWRRFVDGRKQALPAIDSTFPGCALPPPAAQTASDLPVIEG